MVRAEKVLLSILIAVCVVFTPTLAFTGYLGKCCEDGEKGDQGRPGEKGSHGEKGDRGIPGRCSRDVLESVNLSVSVEAGAINGSGLSSGDTKEVRGVLDQLFGACVEDLLANNGNMQQTTITVVKGEKGEKGEQGQSIQGEMGLPGAQGPTGPKGMKGARGEMGDMGSKGEKGEKGEMGSEGPPGPVGNTGIPGPVGPPGQMGLPGPKGDSGQTGKTGLVYIRWGESCCPPHTTLLHDGITVQSANKMTNLLCIPKHSAFSASSTHSHTTTTPTSHITRMEPLLYTNKVGVVDAIPCARCYSNSKSTLFVHPGSSTCPAGWTREYHGHLITSYELSTTDVLCGDEKLTRNIQWRGHTHKAVRRNDLNLLETDCGYEVPSCRGYGAGLVMPCAVCSK